MHIKDNVFVVTGAASGLGAGVARKLASSGARIVMIDRDQDAGAKSASEIGQAVRFIKGDVTSENDGAAAIELAEAVFGGVHGLVNCAGIAPSERTLGRDGPHRLDTFVRAVNINLVGTFNMARLAAAAIARMPPGEDGERGAIVNTASIAAYDGQIGQAAYAASKAGVAGLTLPLARDLARHGIRVVTIAPGIFETPMLAALPEDATRQLAASIPFPQRLGRPEEFAALVVHAIENPMLNGEVIRLDGALRMAPK